MSNNAVLPMLDAGRSTVRSVLLVNPNRDSVYGRPDGAEPLGRRRARSTRCCRS